jgi:pimeloyl-ACP methyl ester carboxylesterase
MAVLLMSCTTAMAQIEPVKKDATVFSYKIHYVEAGRGAPVILLHGSGGEGARWMPTIKGLASEFRVIAPDQIGWGASDKPMTIYHSGVFAEFLARFMKEIGVPKAALVGQSMGAGVALQMAVNYPQLVDRMVLVNGGGFRSANEAPARGRAGLACTADLECRYASGEPRIPEKMYYNHSLITDQRVEQSDPAAALGLYGGVVQIANARGLGGVTEEEVRGIKTPTLLVWGANDKLSPPVNADKLNAAITGSRKVLIDKAGHYPFIEHPDQFNQAVREFLKPQS